MPQANPTLTPRLTIILALEKLGGQVQRTVHTSLWRGGGGVVEREGWWRGWWRGGGVVEGGGGVVQGWWRGVGGVLEGW